MSRAAETSRRGASRGEVLVAAAAVALIAAGVAAIAYAVWRTGRPRPANFRADVPPPPPTDPNLVVCEEIRGGFATGFTKSRGLAVGAGDVLYVSGDFAVRMFDPNGQRVREIAVPEPPGPVGVAPDGALYVGSGGRVLVFDPAGERQGTWDAAGPNSLVTSLAVTEAEVFVADAGLREVRRLDRSGKLLGTIGRKDAARGVPGFAVPSPYFDLALAPDGLLRVVSPGRRRIEAYTLDGDFEGAWGAYAVTPEGFSGCCNPANMALTGVDANAGRFDGFVTAEKGLTRVKLYDSTGTLLGLVAGPESFRTHDERLGGNPPGMPFQALDVAVDGGGRIAVLDPMTNEVRFFRRKKAQGAAP